MSCPTSRDNIVGACGDGCNVLINSDAISGAGQIGNCYSDLTLINAPCGVIDANVPDGTLAIDTGHTVTDAGLLEASNGGTLLIDDAVIKSGCGSALIVGGTLEFGASSNVD